MIVKWITIFTGVFLFLFLFWRKLKDDYSSNIVFTSSLLILLGIFLGYLISIYFFPKWSFWFEAFGAFLGFAAGFVKFNTRFFETYEAFFISLLPWLSLYYLIEFFKTPGFITFLVFALNFSLILLSGFVKAHYKNFSWYKSGKIGLAGLLTSGVFFLARAGIATFAPFVISFAGRSEVILSGVCAFTIFLLIYNLSRSS